MGVLAAVASLALVMTGLLVFRPGPVGQLLNGPAERAAPPVQAPLVLKPVGGAPAPTPAGVQRTLAPLLKDSRLGARVAVSVLDVATNSPLYGATPDARELPASVTKLVTATAALQTRGPAYRLTTRVVAGPGPGEVTLIGGGDPTLATNGHSIYPGAARLDKLAAAVKKSLGGTAPTKVLVDSSLFSGSGLGPGWDNDIVSGGDASPIVPLMVNAGRTDPNGESSQRSPEPDLAAGRRFAALLGVPSTAVAHGTAPKQGPPARRGTVRADGAHRREDVQRSDNVIAEALARQVALAEGPAGVVHRRGGGDHRGDEGPRPGHRGSAPVRRQRAVPS